MTPREFADALIAGIYEGPDGHVERLRSTIAATIDDAVQAERNRCADRLAAFAEGMKWDREAASQAVHAVRHPT